MLPALTHWVVSWRKVGNKVSRYGNYALLLLGPLVGIFAWTWAGLLLFSYGAIHSLAFHFPDRFEKHKSKALLGATLLAISWLLTTLWMPLGVSVSTFGNFLFIAILLLAVLGGFMGFIQIYPKLLTWCLNHKRAFLAFPSLIIGLGLIIWLGFGRVFGFITMATDGLGVNFLDLARSLCLHSTKAPSC